MSNNVTLMSFFSWVNLQTSTYRPVTLVREGKKLKLFTEEDGLG